MLIIGAKLERVRPMGRGREGVEHGRITLAIDCPRKFPFIAHSVKSRMNIRSLIRGKHPTLIKRLVKPRLFQLDSRTSIVPSLKAGWSLQFFPTGNFKHVIVPFDPIPTGLFPRICRSPSTRIISRHGTTTPVSLPSTYHPGARISFAGRLCSFLPGETVVSLHDSISKCSPL